MFEGVAGAHVDITFIDAALRSIHNFGGRGEPPEKAKAGRKKRRETPAPVVKLPAVQQFAGLEVPHQHLRVTGRSVEVKQKRTQHQINK